MILESSDAQAMRRFNESGSTVCHQRALTLGVSMTHRISVDLENVLVEGRIDSNNVSHLVIDFQLQRRHGRVKVDSVEVLQEQDLRITFSSVSWFIGFGRFSDLDDNDVSAVSDNLRISEKWRRRYSRNDMTLVLIQS